MKKNVIAQHAGIILMSNRYTITLLPDTENSCYTCSTQGKAYYSAKFISCECGVIYPEPIVYENSNIKFDIYVEGVPSDISRVNIINSSNDPHIIELARRIADLHNKDIEPIEHSINFAKRYIRNKHGREFEFSGCLGETVTP